MVQNSIRSRYSRRNCADQSLYEGMRKRHVRNRLDFRHLQYPKIGLPLVESIQRIMIRTEIFWQTLPANRSTETSGTAPLHPRCRGGRQTQLPPRKLVHHHQNPMCSQCCGFASEQIAAPQTILHVAEKRKPGWTAQIRFRPVMNRKDTANNILVDLDAESQRDLLGDAGTTPDGIAPFHCDDGVDEFFVRSLRARPTPALAENNMRYFRFLQHTVEMQQSGRLQNDGGTENACPAHEKSAQTGDDPIARRAGWAHACGRD